MDIISGIQSGAHDAPGYAAFLATLIASQGATPTARAAAYPAPAPTRRFSFVALSERVRRRDADRGKRALNPAASAFGDAGGRGSTAAAAMPAGAASSFEVAYA